MGDRAGNRYREIAAIALPALGALAAEPLYLLVDTAIVGHLGTVQLASLALAAAVLGAVVNLCNFLAYGTTARVARLAGAGMEDEAGSDGVQALWLAVAIGGLLLAASVALAGPVMSLLSGDESQQVKDAAARYMRISAIGLPCALIALAAQGYLRGVADLRTPLVVLIWSNALNVVLELLFVYGFDWGLDGSAAGTVLAQIVMAAALTVAVLRRAARSGQLELPPKARRMLSQFTIGLPIMIRTGSLLIAFLVAGAVLARVGPPSLAAHQIAFQLFILLALVLDALAIAAQVLVGRLLGASQGDEAMSTARSMCLLACGAGVVLGVLLMAGHDLIPRAFTSDPAVLDQAAELWPIFALMLPVGAVVFALDGILLGAGDLKYLAGAMVFSALGVFRPLALASLHFGWGVRGVWWGIFALMAARLLTLWPRLVGRRWMRLGAA